MNKIPKDRQIIIITKQGTYASQWSPADKKFVYANPQIDMFYVKCDMYYYENEYIKEEDITSWREI